MKDVFVKFINVKNHNHSRKAEHIDKWILMSRQPVISAVTSTISHPETHEHAQNFPNSDVPDTTVHGLSQNIIL